jgi:hypothetical protein
MRLTQTLGVLSLLAFCPMSVAADPQPNIRVQPRLPPTSLKLQGPITPWAVLSEIGSTQIDPNKATFAVHSCPATLTFVAGVNSSPPLAPTTQVQYKWVRSDGKDFPTHTTAYSSLPTDPNMIVTWQFPAGSSGWIQLQVSYPYTVSSKKLAFSFTCPTPGSLTQSWPNGR